MLFSKNKKQNSFISACNDINKLKSFDITEIFNPLAATTVTEKTLRHCGNCLRHKRIGFDQFSRGTISAAEGLYLGIVPLLRIVIP